MNVGQPVHMRYIGLRNKANNTDKVSGKAEGAKLRSQELMSGNARARRSGASNSRHQFVACRTQQPLRTVQRAHGELGSS
jgi:hypothetical protein